jgi:hypothetical protein
MDTLFKKIEEEKIPEIPRKIKPSKFNENKNKDENNIIGHKNDNENYILKSIEEKKQILSVFLKKYIFLEYKESLDFQSINIEGI